MVRDARRGVGSSASARPSRTATSIYRSLVGSSAREPFGVLCGHVFVKRVAARVRTDHPPQRAALGACFQQVSCLPRTNKCFVPAGRPSAPAVPPCAAERLHHTTMRRLCLLLVALQVVSAASTLNGADASALTVLAIS